MSTRATYQFVTEYNTSTIYVHHDGYPEGAVNYFNLMLLRDFSDSLSYSIKNISAESFIRANLKAELTESHEAHGDTEYRYTFNKEVLTCEARIDFGDTWRTVFTGNVYDFINEYRIIEYDGKTYEQSEEWIAITKPKLDYVPEHTEYWSKPALTKWLLNHLDKAGRDFLTMTYDNPNLIKIRAETKFYLSVYKKHFANGSCYNVIDELKEAA